MKLIQFTHWLKNQNLSPETIRSYQWAIQKYGEQPLNTQQISQFIQTNREKYQAQTLRNQRNALAAYAKFQQKQIEWKRIAKLIPQVQRKFWATINQEELTKLKQSQLKTSQAINQRHNLMLDFLFYGGLRVGELVRIKHQDWEDNALRVHGKGNKVRYILLPKWLSKYFNPRLTGYLFLTRKGKHLTGTQVRMFLSRKVSKAGIQKRITPHTFRRSLATNLYNKGGKLETIQKQLGHSSLDTTMGYIHNDFNALYADYSKLFQTQPNQGNKPPLKDYSTAELLAEIGKRVGNQQSPQNHWEAKQKEPERRSYA